MTTLLDSPLWTFIDSGIGSGEVHMKQDAELLQSFQDGMGAYPTLRFFEWDTPTVSHGFMMDPIKSSEWAKTHRVRTVVKRPTGGGVVFHDVNDLSFSLVWPRHKKIFSETPRQCYAEIHSLVKKATLRIFDSEDSTTPTLFSSGITLKETCQDGNLISSNTFSLCFERPVCNDIMIGNKKIVGGALRITKNAILYQGTIQWHAPFDKNFLKNAIRTQL